MGAKNVNIVISSLFFYKEDLADEFVRVLMDQLAHAARHAGARVQLVVSLNFPFTPAVWRRIADQNACYRAKGVECRFIERGHNLGFGASHNHVFEKFASDVFVVINNDLFCEREDWLTAMVQKLGPNGDADLVGTDETRAALRASDGSGLPRADPAGADFMEGSLLGLRSSAIHKLGLFSDSFHFFYFEDSDLGLRYRQAGARIASIPVPHRHLRWSGSRQLPRSLVKNILDINRAIFFSRWSGYLARRTFSGRVHADLRALSPEGCIEALPALLALSRDHPGARLEIALPESAPREFFWHPQWEVQAANVPAKPDDYDRTWTANKIEPQEDLPAVLAHFRNLGGSYPAAAVRRYLQDTAERLGAVLPPPDAPAPRALIVAAPPHPKINGVTPVPEFFAPAAALLRTRGYFPAWAVGEARQAPDQSDSEVFIVRTCADWLRIVAASEVVVGPMGTALTFAQFLGRKAYALSGAVLPERGLWAWETSGAFIAANLDCLGCRHAWGSRERCYCLRRDEACIRTDLGPEFARALDTFLSRETSSPADAMAAAQRLRLISRRTSPDLDLSQWIDD
jgi:GT2 family glycosyltransferase